MSDLVITATIILTSYVVNGEILFSMYGYIGVGKLVLLPTIYKNKWYTAFMWKRNIEYAINNHMIEAVIKSLKKAGYK